MGRYRFREHKDLKKRKKSYLVFIVIVLLTLLAVPVFFLTRARYWDGKTKLSVVINGKDNVLISTFDPTLGEVTTLKIPGSTQVEVSRNLGSWKLGSVWKLGKNEKVGGRLLQETIAKNFNFPIISWADTEAFGLSKGEVSAFVSSVLTPYETNLSYGDKLRLYLFSVRVSKAKQTEIDLAQTVMLRKTKLADGEDGYLLTKSVPVKLIGVFSDNEISNSLLRVAISDSSGRSGLSENVGKIVETLGAKVVAKTVDKVVDLDCVIVSSNRVLAQRISEIFHCKIENQKPEGNFDLVFKIGEGFAERF